MKFRIKSLAILSIAFLGTSALHAQAATQSSSVTVTTTVAQSCQIVSTTNLNFGVYTPAGVNDYTPLDATNTVQVRCVAQSSGVQLAFDQGQHADASSTCDAPLRRMLGTTGDYLNYHIFADAARTIPYGCSAGVNTKNFNSSEFTSAANPVTVTQYGRIPAGQDPFKTTYSDVVGVTVSF